MLKSLFKKATSVVTASYKKVKTALTPKVQVASTIVLATVVMPATSLATDLSSERKLGTTAGEAYDYLMTDVLYVVLGIGGALLTLAAAAAGVKWAKATIFG